MAVRVRKNQGFDATSSIRERRGEYRRRGRLEHHVAMLKPTSVEQHEPRRAEYLGATIEERLSQRMSPSGRCLAAMFEVRLQLADCIAVERRLELLVNDQLVRVVRAV